MIVGLCGFGNSGASAFLDYFRGYNELGTFCEFEFQLLHQADGINDLKYHLVHSKERITCNAAIQRFIRLQKYGAFGRSMKKKIGNRYTDWYSRYISELTVTKWIGKMSIYDPLDITKESEIPVVNLSQRVINKVLCKINDGWGYPFPKEKYFSILDEETFDKITKKYLDELFVLVGLKGDINIVDMLFSVTNPSQGMEFFDSVKAISVVRDPRDVYIESKRKLGRSRYMPNDSVSSFISYYKTIRENIDSCKADNILITNYEDLIYKYDETTEKVRLFLNINEKPEKEFKYFNPLVSAKYTNRVELYRKFDEDIRQIEEMLGQYIYDFTKVTHPREDSELTKRIETAIANNKVYTVNQRGDESEKI